MDSTDHGLNVTDASLKPVYRRLRGYAFDPSFANRLDAFGINTIVYPIRWEDLQPGPIGEYVEVVDIDPASGVFYPPVDLSDPHLMAQDGLPPSESNPQFHQQMVYAVAMTTIQNFEKALGRPVQWSSTDYDVSQGKSEGFVQRLRLYPHAIRDANAYYSSSKKAVLFGYFSARPNDESILMPGSLVFTCLSHDIISHEVTHALIDGIYKGYIYPVHEDTLGLHEAFSDLVALFQHFTFHEVLENQITRTRGDLKGQQLLSELAQQFGLAVGSYSALRDAIGGPNEKGEWESTKPDPKRLKNEPEPHARGSILVAAIFDAFLNIYQKRTADLNRIASDGTGILAAGNLHPDLVKRLAAEASRTAKQFLSLCIRALDYCPPIGTTFGEFLRALITADVDLVRNDPLGYRVALIESFKRWGIYPDGIRTLSVENLIYNPFTEADLLELTADEERQRAEEQDENISSTTSFFQKIDNLMLEASNLSSDVKVLVHGQTPKTKQQSLNDRLESYQLRMLDILDSYKNEVGGSKQNASVYKGELEVRENQLQTTRTIKSDLGQDVNQTWVEFWFLMEHYYNQTAVYRTNRKRLFLITQEYKRRLHYLFADASESVKKRLQPLLGILFQSSEYEQFCQCKEKVEKILVAMNPLKKSDLSIDRIYQPSMEPEKETKKSPKLSFRIDSLHRAQRVGPDTNVLHQVVITMMQRFRVELTDNRSGRKLPDYDFSGGCTLVIDIDQKTVRFIQKGVIALNNQSLEFDAVRLANELRRRYMPNLAETVSPFAPSRWPMSGPANGQAVVEPFALLHQND